jgi:hypothetical protein
MVACPYCRVAIGENCSGLTLQRAHPSRIETAALAMGLSQAEADDAVRFEQISAVKRYRSLHGESTLDAQNQNFSETTTETLANTVSEV